MAPGRPRRVPLFCGGRDFTDYAALHDDISILAKDSKVRIIIAGGAPGLDTLAAEVAGEFGIHCASAPALWDIYGRHAGRKRNTAMTLLEPTECWAYPTGGPGTRMMMAIAKEFGIPVYDRMNSDVLPVLKSGRLVLSKL